MRAACALLIMNCGVGAFVSPNRVGAFVSPNRLAKPHSSVIARPAYLEPDLGLFDDDDISPMDTLFRCGFIPFSVRMTRPETYEEDVQKFMRGEWLEGGMEPCTRLEAQRSIDMYYRDPNGFMVQLYRQVGGWYGVVRHSRAHPTSATRSFCARAFLHVVRPSQAKDPVNEKIDLYAKTGVMARPVFSALWASFLGWFAVGFLPTRLAELAELHADRDLLK